MKRKDLTPSLLTTTYTYDPAGNLVSTTDSRAAVTTRSYDALGRVTQSVTTLGLESETVTWGYDSGTFGIGRLATMTDPSGSTTYAYQRLGMLASEIRTTGGEVYVSSYTYAEDGERASLTYPSGRRVDYGYDWAGRPTTASVGGTTHYVTGATYLPFGPMTSLSYGNGVTKTVQFDNRYRVDRITLGALADYDYTSDPAGNITGIADLTDPAYNRTYGYDELNRLTTAASGASLWGAGTYAYDAMGNMTSYQIGSRTGAFAWQGTTPKIATATEAGATIPVAYDAAGNELTGTRANGAGVPSEQRWYSPRNSLHLVYLSPSGTVTRPCEVGQICPNEPAGHTYYEFGYDGRGIRTTEVLHDGATATSRHYTYSPEMSLLGWKTSGLPAGLEVIWFAGAPIAQEAWGATTASRLTFTDHLGTPLLQMDGSGAVVWRAEYEPYGNVYAMRTGTKDDQPLRFPGQERLFDGSTGTEERYNIKRWFRSGWGRYSQADPLEELRASEPNLFTYARLRPTSLTDPFGLWTVDESCDTCPNGYCFGGRETVREGINIACNKFRKKPKCATFIENLQFGPTMDNSGVEPLGPCMKRLCESEDNKIYCAQNTDPRNPGACAKANPGGNITLMCGEGTSECYFDKGGGWSHTIFHEMVHVCGLTDPDSESYGTGPYSKLFQKIMYTCAGVLN